MKRYFIFFLMLILSFRANAVSPPSKMQYAVSGIIESKVASRGFAANDPRYGATLQAVGAVAGGAAAAGVVGGLTVTAPAWVTAAAVIGVGILFTTAINWGIDSAIKYLFNKDGSVVVNGFTPGAGGTNSNLIPGVNYGSFTNRDGTVVLIDTVENGYKWWSNSNAGYILKDCAFAFSNFDGSSVTACGAFYPAVPPSTYEQYAGFRPMFGVKNAGNTYNGQPCNGAIVAGVCKSNYTSASTPSSKITNQDTAVKEMPVEEKKKPLNPDILADLINELLKQAALQDKYAGIPNDIYNPVTPEDVNTWKNNNPGDYPEIGDFVNPQSAPVGEPAASPFSPSPAGSPSPSGSPGGSPAGSPGGAVPAPINPAAENPLANLGPDPVIGAPMLEAPPTALMIIQPLFDLFPSFKKFVVPGHSSVCPKPSASAFGTTITLSSHCDLVEPIKPVLTGVMAFVWVMIAVFIILSA